MNAPLASELLVAEAPTLEFTLDGRSVTARAGETIWSVARREGTTIPHLCHSDGLTPVGNCRACMVEVEGERVLAASCCRSVAAGMKVKTDSERAVTARSLAVVTFIPAVGFLTQEAASTRSPSTSTMQARQLPSAR
jgi:formate dehydrogenase major subunit